MPSGAVGDKAVAGAWLFCGSEVVRDWKGLVRGGVLSEGLVQLRRTIDEKTSAGWVKARVFWEREYKILASNRMAGDSTDRGCGVMAAASSP